MFLNTVEETEGRATFGGIADYYYLLNNQKKK